MKPGRASLLPRDDGGRCALFPSTPFYPVRVPESKKQACITTVDRLSNVPARTVRTVTISPSPAERPPRSARHREFRLGRNPSRYCTAMSEPIQIAIQREQLKEVILMKFSDHDDTCLNPYVPVRRTVWNSHLRQPGSALPVKRLLPPR